MVVCFVNDDISAESLNDGGGFLNGAAELRSICWVSEWFCWVSGWCS